MSEFQIKKRVKAIIGITINADTAEEAIEKAEKKLYKEGLFKEYIEYLDGNEELIGYDNLDLWNIETD